MRLFDPATGLFALTARSLTLIGAGLLCLTIRSAMAADTAEAMYQQCRSKPSIAEQRDCFPAVVRQSEFELAAAEKKARADMVELESISASSRAVHPVLAFDGAAHTFRAFRDAESRRVLASYGSGNGGALSAYATSIEMNIARARLLASEAGTR